MVGVVYALYTLDPTLTLNYGLVRPVRAIMPAGTVMHAIEPAAVGMRSLLNNVCQTAVIGAFARALPDRLPASPANGLSLMNVKTATKAGRMVMASIGPVGGGAGGGPAADGAEGSGANMSFLKNTPVEINEAEMPVRILRYGLVPDTAGPGRWRGGSALEMEFQVFAPQTMVTARNRDRTVFSAWGLAGGGAGASSRFAKNPNTPAVVELGSTDVVGCNPGDIILIQGPGGGGYGNPLERPVAEIQADLASGLLTAGRAREEYAVVVGDDAATARLRGEMGRKRTVSEFGHGPGRRGFEAVWSPARYDVLTQLLAALPVTWRFFIKHRLFAALAGQIAPMDGGAADVVRAYEAVITEFADLPPPPPDLVAQFAAAAE
jgi:N-methylhydantoinase B